jgi:hypothetical protein
LVTTENDHVPKTIASNEIIEKNARYPKGIKQCVLSFLVEKIFPNIIAMIDSKLKSRICSVEINKSGEVSQF